MDSPDLVTLFVRPLEGLGIDYMVTGGVAAVVYGDPRFTRDIDVILKLKPEDASRLEGAFDRGRFYVPPVDVLRREARRSPPGHFNVIDKESALRADIYISGSDPLHEWAFGRRRTLDIEGTRMSIAPPEYVILRKLEYYRSSSSDRHLRDVAMILAVSPEQVDVEEIEAWIVRLDLKPEWAAARAYVPE